MSGKSRWPFRGASFTPEFNTGITVMAVYSIIFFLAGLVLSKRKMMEG